MSKLRYFFLVIASTLLLTSCFEFVEEIKLREDGSGQATFTLNLSRSKTKLASIMLLDSVNGYKVPSKIDIREGVRKMLTKIKATKGISNVKHELDFEEFILSVSCDFQSVENLNQVLINFSSKKQIAQLKKHRHFSFDKGKRLFKRSHHFDIAREFRKAKKDDQQIFESASFTGVYRFDEAVAKASNSLAKVAKSKKAVLLRVKAADIISNKQTIKNTIQLQN